MSDGSFSPSPIRLPRHGGIDEAVSLLPGNLSKDDILDFSISINPLGPPPGLKEALARELETIHRYPEITAATLGGRLAESHGLTPDHIIVGNGSSDLLFSLVSQLPERRALIPYPTFVEYARICEIAGWKIHHLPPADPRDLGFDVPLILSRLAPETVLFLCQPNNPTGRSLSPPVLNEIVSKAHRVGCRVVLDEAFLPFTDTPSAIPWIQRFDNLIVLRSMTKSYGIPGLRLGYAAASPAVISRWKTFLPPWNVNALAQAAGRYCLEHAASYLAESRRYTRQERERMERRLRRLPPLRPLPSQANFFLIFIDTAEFTADALYLSLAGRGILVRHCGSFRGMKDRHLRIGLKTRAQNQRLLDALTDILPEIAASETAIPRTSVS